MVRAASFSVDHKNEIYQILTSEDVAVQDFCRTIDNFHYFTFLSMIGYTLYFMHAWPCLSLPAHAVTHKLLFPSRISIPTLS